MPRPYSEIPLFVRPPRGGRRGEASIAPEHGQPLVVEPAVGGHARPSAAVRLPEVGEAPAASARMTGIGATSYSATGSTIASMRPVATST